MFFLTDTCFWSHVKDLHENDIIDLRPVLDSLNWAITDEVSLEIDRQKLGSFFPHEHAIIIPVTNEQLENTKKQIPTIGEFDIADQTLIVVGRKDEQVVLTDDGELYMECIALGIQTMLLPQFCLSLTLNGMMDKTVVFRALRFWETTRRYSLKFIKKWKNELKEIRGFK